jgi:hypothetical protein
MSARQESQRDAAKRAKFNAIWRRDTQNSAASDAPESRSVDGADDEEDEQRAPRARAEPAPPPKSFLDKTLSNAKKSAAYAKKGGTAARPALRAAETRRLVTAFENAPGRKRADQHQLGELTGEFNAARKAENAAALAELERARASAKEALERARSERRRHAITMRQSAATAASTTTSRSKRKAMRAANVDGLDEELELDDDVVVDDDDDADDDGDADKRRESASVQRPVLLPPKAWLNLA